MATEMCEEYRPAVELVIRPTADPERLRYVLSVMLGREGVCPQFG